MATNLTRFLQKKETRVLIKKYWITIMFLILIGMGLLAQQIHPVNATVPVNLAIAQTKIKNLLKGMSISNVSYMKQAYDKFTTLAGNRYKGTDILTIMNTASGFITALAIFICMIFSIIGIIKESQRGEISEDYWTRVFVSSVVAIVVVANVNTVMNSLYDTGSVIIEQMTEAALQSDRLDNNANEDKRSGSSGEGGSESDLSEREKTLLHALSLIPGLNGYESNETAGAEGTESEESTEAGGGTGGSGKKDDEAAAVRIGSIEDVYNGNVDDYLAIQHINELIDIFQIVGILPLLASVYLIYSMIFEIKLRQLFAPMAVATIGYEGARSSALRFLKKYFACYLRIAMYFVIAALGSQLTNYFLDDICDQVKASTSTLTPELAASILLMFGANVLAALTMLQAGTMADEIIGA